MSTTLTELMAQTARLGKRLQGLVKKYPDDSVEPDGRIFSRILTNDWRRPIGGVHGPLDKRYWDAVAWVESFDAYVRKLLAYFAQQPERLATLPLTRRLRLPAAQLLQLFELQRDMLTLEEPKPQVRNKDIHELRKRLQHDANALGSDELADRIGCNRDTLSDFLLGKTKPQEKTMKKLRAYAQSH